MDKFLLNRVRSLPEQTRMRILWVTMALIAAGLMVLWVSSTRETIKGMDASGLLTTKESKQVNYIKAEWIERADGKLKIFFKITNTTNSIMTFSNMDQISLTADRNKTLPLELLDRQGQPFVKKILSQTENYGVVVFNDVSQDNVEITFQNLFFENDETTILDQTIDLDLKQLNKPLELKS